jgi:hypothetical protein
MAKGFLVRIFLGESHPSAIPKRLILLAIDVYAGSLLQR